MADKALENAEAMLKQLLERRKALNAELINIEDQIGQITKFVKSWHLFAEADIDGIDHTSVIAVGAQENKPEPERSVKTKQPKNTDRLIVGDEALKIIRERGQPVSRSDLYKELTNRGMVILGKDNEMVLSTMLWRSRDRIVRLRTGGYWIADEDWPDANYLPSLTEQISKERTADDLLV